MKINQQIIKNFYISYIVKAKQEIKHSQLPNNKWLFKIYLHFYVIYFT